MKTLVIFLTVNLLISLTPAQAQNDSLRLFIIGNSFSGNAAEFLPALAKEGGHKLIIGRAELGGCSLERHWQSVVANNIDSLEPKGKPYNGKSLRQLLSAGKWDVVTLQQFSLLSGDIDTYLPFAEMLFKFIKTIQPKAKVVLHQTWAYRADDRLFGYIKDTIRAGSEQEMWEKSRAAYRRVAKDLRIQLIPVGDAFHKAITDKKFPFKGDSTYPYNQPVYPELPKESNSLHAGYSWDKEQKLKFDSHHASEAGCYLGGLLWYAFLFKENPTTLQFKPAGVSSEFASYLKTLAAASLKTSTQFK